MCGGQCPGATSENLEGIQALRNEVRDLGKANEILRQVSVYAAASELSPAIPGYPWLSPAQTVSARPVGDKNPGKQG